MENLEREHVAFDAAVESLDPDSDLDMVVFVAAGQDPAPLHAAWAEFRETDPRVQVVRVHALPIGWAGKAHAIQAGLEALGDDMGHFIAAAVEQSRLV